MKGSEFGKVGKVNLLQVTAGLASIFDVTFTYLVHATKTRGGP